MAKNATNGVNDDINSFIYRHLLVLNPVKVYHIYTGNKGINNKNFDDNTNFDIYKTIKD